MDLLLPMMKAMDPDKRTPDLAEHAPALAKGPNQVTIVVAHDGFRDFGHRPLNA